MIAVYNSSPIIFLSKLDLLKQAFSLFEKNYVPAGVIEEITHRENIYNEALNNLVRCGNVIIKTAAHNLFFERLRESLGNGETEAILCALEINSDNDYVILDDKTARKKALSYGLRVKGTIGIIRMLYQESLLKQPPGDLYKKLIGYNFRVDKYIFNSILSEFFKQ